MRSPCSLGRVPTSVTTFSASCASTCPRSWRSCTRSSTSAIQTRFGVTSTQAPRGGSLRSCGSRAPCTAPCVSGARPRPCGPVGSGHPCFLRTAGGTGVRGDAEKSPRAEDSSRHPRARSKRPSCSTGGCGTTCGTKDTGPSRVTPAVRPPFVSPSAGLHMRSSFPSGRAALGGLEHANSDAEFLRTFRDSLVLVLCLSALCASCLAGTQRAPTGHHAGWPSADTPARAPAGATR